MVRLRRCSSLPSSPHILSLLSWLSSCKSFLPFKLLSRTLLSIQLTVLKSTCCAILKLHQGREAPAAARPSSSPASQSLSVDLISKASNHKFPLNPRHRATPPTSLLVYCFCVSLLQPCHPCRYCVPSGCFLFRMSINISIIVRFHVLVRSI